MKKTLLISLLVTFCFSDQSLQNTLVDLNSTELSEDNITTPIVVKKPTRVLKKLSLGEIIDENSTQAKGDWQGYYFGILPCSTCKGVATWLHLEIVQNRGEYEMREKFLGVKNRYSLGGIGWENNGSIIKILSKNNKKRFRIVGKNLDLLDSNTSMQNLTLKKYDTFNDEFSVFIIDPKDILKGKSHGKSIVRFKGLINYDNLTQNGYKSKKISLMLHCKNQKYELSRVSYYKKRYAMGGFIHSDENTRGLFDMNTSQLILKASQKYCP